ncbi:MAG: OmpA family protein [Chitinophagales bacterium]
MKKSFLNILFMAAVVAIITTSCHSKGDNPGWIYMPDMTYSNAYETYSSTHHQTQGADSMSARKPVSGTIPRGYLPNNSRIQKNEKYINSFIFKNNFKNPIEYPELDQEQRAMAKTMLKNPYKRTDDVMKAGKAKYDIYCAVCHGKDGEGNGQIVERPDGSEGPFVSIPPNFKTSAAKNGRLHGLTDGDMFYSISYGKNMMGGYYTQINAEDRWKIIHYIKNMAGISDDYEAFERSEDGKVKMDLASVELKKGAEINVPDIYFTTGSSKLKSESYYILDQLVKFFDDNKTVKVEIGSHSDARGDDEKNMILSQERAASVVTYLSSKNVNLEQLSPKGYGETMPAVPCGEDCTDAQFEKNRRTTFKILQVK